METQDVRSPLTGAYQDARCWKSLCCLDVCSQTKKQVGCDAAAERVSGLAVDAGLAAIGCVFGIICFAADFVGKALPPHIREEPNPVRAQLPSELGRLFVEGQVFAALILSTSFSEKYRGRDLVPGAVGPVKVPTPDAEDISVQWKPTLFSRAGNREAVAFVWVGDESVGDSTVYVAFSMLRYFAQAKKIFYTARDPVIDEADPVSADSLKDDRNDPRSTWERLTMATYVRRKIDKLWQNYGLGAQLSEVIAKYPNHRLMFAGISHGASLAQAAALRTCIELPEAQERTFCVSWNAYKWIGEDGTRLAAKVLGDRLLPFALSKWMPKIGSRRGRTCWDSISGCPDGFEPMPNLILLDVDTGILAQSNQYDDCPGQTRMTLEAFRRLLHLHYASAAISATRKAIRRCFIERDQ